MNHFHKISFHFLLLATCFMYACQHTNVQQNTEDLIPMVDANKNDNIKNYALTPEDTFNVGQLVYIPIYSEIYSYSNKKTFPLSATLSIHNIDLNNVIYITKVDYYDTKGKLIRTSQEEPILLNPLATKHYVIETTEKKGGVGANFLVEWKAIKQSNKPIIEAVMISTASNTGISFVTQGRTMLEYLKESKAQ